MENTMMVFEGNEVEVFEFEGKVLFNPRDVAECLGIKDVKSSMRHMNEKQVVKLTNSKVHSIHFRKLHNTGENFLTESGVYNLIFKSRKAEAERFQDWVTDEVLPQIRQTGGYIPVKEEESTEEFLARALLVAKTTMDKKDELIAQQRNTIEVQAPKVDSYNRMIDADGLLDIGSVSKSLNIKIGRNKLFAFLKENKVLMPSNIPYQSQIDAGRFKVKAVTKGNLTFPKTFVTPKGVDYINNLLMKSTNNGLPLNKTLA